MNADPRTTVAAEGEAPYLAVDVLPNNAPGTLLLDVSELDGGDLLGWGMDGWTNIVCDVTQVSATRGATRLQGPLTRTEAGTAGVQLIDTARRFDPMVNADAIHPGTPVRVRVWMGPDPAAPDWETVLFTGNIGTDLDVRYSPADAPLVSFTAVDLVGPLARYGAVGRPDPGTGAGDTLLQRVQRVVDEVGLPAGSVATDSDTAYAATLAPTSLTSGWGAVTAAADAELGRVWVTAAGQLTVRGRGSELTGPVRGTLSDVHGEEVAGAGHCCYRDPLVRFGTESLTNRAVGARRVPRSADGSQPPASALVQVDDVYSQARWTADVPVVHEDRSLELETDAQLVPWAEWLVMTAAEPELRVDEVTPVPGDSPAAWRALCETDIGDRWVFRLTPQTGPRVERTLGVLGIVHSITPDGWTTTWTTTEAPTPGDTNPGGWFTVDLSELDSGDVLVPGAVTADEWDGGVAGGDGSTIIDGGGA